VKFLVGGGVRLVVKVVCVLFELIVLGEADVITKLVDCNAEIVVEMIIAEEGEAEEEEANAVEETIVNKKGEPVEETTVVEVGEAVVMIVAKEGKAVVMLVAVEGNDVEDIKFVCELEV
jgi:hypothetical protein